MPCQQMKALALNGTAKPQIAMCSLGLWGTVRIFVCGACEAARVFSSSAYIVNWI